MARAEDRIDVRKSALLTLLLLGGVLAARGFLEALPEWSARLRADGRLALPLAACVPIAIALVWLRRRDARGGAPADGALGLLSLALAAWLGLVAAAALVVGATPAFLWGALAPYFLGALAFTIVRALAPTAGELRLALVVAGAVVAVAVLLDAEGLPLGDGGDALLRRPRGLLYNRNYAGEYLALVLPVCLTAAAAARDGRRLARVVHGALVVVVGLALIWTRCRTAWLAAAGGSAMVVLTAARTARPRLARVVALVVAGAALALVVPNRLQWSEAQPFAATARRLLKLKSGSGALRLEQYAATVRLVAAHPVAGLGPGGWQPAIRAGDWRLGVNRNAHSDYLRALADGGPAAAAALLALYGAALVAAWRARRRFAEAPALVLTLATISAADALLYRPEAAILAFAALAALGASYSSPRRTQLDPLPSPSSMVSG